MPILVLTGAAGAGKNFVASALAELMPDVPLRELSFAQTLKDMMAALPIEIPTRYLPFHPENSHYFTAEQREEIQTILYSHPSAGSGPWMLLTLVDAFGWDLLKPIPYFRRLLQVFGTDIARTHLGEDIWVEAFIKRHRDTLTDPKVLSVITDTRFPNELAALKKLDTPLLHVQVLSPTALLSGESAAHASETALAGIQADLDYVNVRAEEPIQYIGEHLLPQLLDHMPELKSLREE